MANDVCIFVLARSLEVVPIPQLRLKQSVALQQPQVKTTDAACMNFIFNLLATGCYLILAVFIHASCVVRLLSKCMWYVRISVRLLDPLLFCGCLHLAVF